MEYCPVCNAKLEKDATYCHVCGYEINKDEERAKWIVLGYIDDKISADFAKETLKAYNIPVVIFSKSGFFGDIGLTLNPFYKASSATYEVSVPEEFEEEAIEILNMTIGKKWQRKESK
ncbi:MAG: zinc ribbon domain-containing protein [FCB group bacterium]|nr:zinc ribbon domain-containing protein [FCB group bacterium]